MLVLTRKLGEAIQIGENVTIEVLDIRGGRVRLGITAPSDVNIHRSEILIPINSAAEEEASTPVGRASGLFAAVHRRAAAVSGT